MNRYFSILSVKLFAIQRLNHCNIKAIQKQKYRFCKFNYSEPIWFFSKNCWFTSQSSQAHMKVELSLFECFWISNMIDMLTAHILPITSKPPQEFFIFLSNWAANNKKLWIFPFVIVWHTTRVELKFLWHGTKVEVADSLHANPKRFTVTDIDSLCSESCFLVFRSFHDMELNISKYLERILIFSRNYFFINFNYVFILALFTSWWKTNTPTMSCRKW